MDAIVFEVSNEVANKVGGIHAVIASKARQMRKNFGEYYTIGPCTSKNISLEFEQIKTHVFNSLFRQLGEQGIKCMFGRWIAANKANCILVDPIGLRNQLNDIKTKLWERYGVDSLISWDLFNDSVVWGKAVGILIENMLRMEKFKDENVICQFHEWLTGSALLHLHSAKSRAGLVFTTHATTMGRTMAERGEDIIREVEDAAGENKTISYEKVKRYGVQCVHTLEKACAHNADVFTAVSKITGDESRYILDKYPDVLTLNGLSVDNYPSMEELSIAHAQFRQRIEHYVLACFSPYYNMDTKKCLFFFTSGRSEFHNKGYDILIEALGRLNERLRKEKSKKAAVVFIWVPTKTKGRNLEVLDNISLFESMENEVVDNLDEIREHIIESVCNGKLPTKAKVFDEPFLYDLKQMILRMRAKRGKNTPISALTLDNENDPILNGLLEKGLDNKQDDPIKVVYYPTYLSSADGLLGLNYNEAIIGCHLGIFPSYYEPWGYTPVETAALGVPSVTTDFAGFGQFIKNYVEGTRSAIRVLERDLKGDDEAIEQLVDYMYYLVHTTKKERVKKKIEAKRLSEIADWRNLIENYVAAYELALKRAPERVEDG
jgi:glycogen(starch) synthase